MAKSVASLKLKQSITDEEMAVHGEKFKKDRIVNKVKNDFIKDVKTKKDFTKFKLVFERKDKQIEESNIGLSLYRSSLGVMAIKAKIKAEAETENPIKRIITFAFGSAMKVSHSTEDSKYENPEDLLEDVKDWVEGGNDIKDFGSFSDYMLIELFDKTSYHFSLYDIIEGAKNKEDDKLTDVVVNPNFCDFKKVKYSEIEEGLLKSKTQVNYFK